MNPDEPARQPERAPRPGGVLRVAQIFGVPIYLTPSWIVLSLVLILYYGPLIGRRLTGITPYLLGLSIVVSLLVTVLLHELGHAAVARRFRVGVRGITLELLGGFTELEGEAPSPLSEAMIALAGPAVSFLLAAIGGAGLLVTDRGTILGDFVFQAAVTNLIVAVFNVLPGLPLDGGRALRAGIWRITRNPDRAELLAGWSGRGIAVVTVVAGVLLYRQRTTLSIIGLLFFVMIAVTLWRGASQSIKVAELKQRLPHVRAGSLARPLHLVATGTPLAEALRQRDEALQVRDDAYRTLVVLGVTNSAGTIIGLISPRSIAAVPPERRPWVAIDAVASAVLPTQRISAESDGTAVLATIQANPGGDLLVTVGEDVVGVLRIADVITMLNS